MTAGIFRVLVGIERKMKNSQVQWLTPVIPELWEVKLGRSLEVGSSRPAWPTWQNPVPTKNTKNYPGMGVVALACIPSCFGGCGGMIA